VKKTTALLTLVAALGLTLPAVAAPSYVGLDQKAVNNYYTQAAMNISCSTGTWLNGPNAGLSEHLTHYGPLGWCGILVAGSGDYHIISVSYYMTSGGGTSTPNDPKYDGADPRTTPWTDLKSGTQHTATDWKDADRDGRLSPGDGVAFDGGPVVPVSATGTAAAVEQSIEKAAH
jgi:hypothetical protein